MFLMPPLIKARKISLSRTDGAGSSSLLTTHNFSAVDIGDPSPDRTIILIVSSFSDGGPNSWTESVTIGGSSPTLISRVNLGQKNLSMYRIDIQNGNTADVAVSSGTAVSCAIFAYRLVGRISASPTATGSGSTGSPSISFTKDVPANSVALMAAMATGITGTSHAWSGDGFPSPTSTTSGTNGIRTSAARDEHDQAQTGLDFTVTFSTSSGGFQPAVMAIWN